MAGTRDPGGRHVRAGQEEAAVKEPEPAARGPLAPCPVPFGANTGSARAVPAPWKPLSAPRCCAWRPGQASPKTPSAPPPPPTTALLHPSVPHSSAPCIGSPVAWPLATFEAGPATLLWPAHPRHAQPGHPVPRGPATQPEPQAPTGRQGPGQGGRSPSPGPRNAIGSGCRASVPGSPGSWQRLVARAPRDPGCTCPAGEGSRGRGPGGQRGGAFADSAFLG